MLTQRLPHFKQQQAETETDVDIHWKLRKLNLFLWQADA